MSDLSLGSMAALALLPLSGVVGGFVVQSLIAGRTVYIGSITAERSKWIEKLRANLSAYYSLSASVVLRRSELKKLPDGELKQGLTKERYADLQKLEELASLLRLQLNPGGEIDGNLIAIIEELQAHQEDDGDRMSDIRELLISHSQWLLKAEWEKVKWEASGRVHRLLHRRYETKSLTKYKVWVASATPAERKGWPAKLQEFASPAVLSETPPHDGSPPVRNAR